LILPFLLAALAFVTLLAILAPLLRGSRPGLDRASYDQAVYRDQLRELDRDVARGLLTLAEASSAGLEIQRRILATDRLAAGPLPDNHAAADARTAHSSASDASAVTDPVAIHSPASVTRRSAALTTAAFAAPPARLTRSPMLAGVLFVAIAVGSVGVYLRLGAPEVPDEPFTARQAEAAAVGKDRLTMEQATFQLAAKLQANPSDPQGWLLYGRSLAMLNRWAAAEDAYRHAMALGENSLEVTADHAEMLVLAAGGTVTPAAEAAFRQILANDPSSGVARYYLAIAASQAGEPRRAIDLLQALLADMPADSPLRGQIGQRIAEAAQAARIPAPELAKGAAPASGPDADAVASAAGMSDEQRQAMIQGMVSHLAAQQQADPGNLDGWLRLARAYTVLREPDKAADAFEKAASLKPDDGAIPLQELRALLADHKPTDRLPPRVVGLLKRIAATDPREPVVLWFLGVAATQDRHPDEARRYWGVLLAKLPPTSDDARMIQAALNTLPASEPASGSASGRPADPSIDLPAGASSRTPAATSGSGE